jgi:predicted phosphoribosyltransferase/pimeloyl-ACP methyl ester carboxylesterase
MFRDRTDAGRQLAVAVKEKGYVRPVVLGIPRGGVPVAAEVARAVNGELAVVVARKLGAPGNPELAIGATTETGASYVNTATALAVGASQHYIESETERQRQEAQRREQLFNSHRRPSVRDRTVVIVDDGVATGATAIAAVRSLKAEGAARVVLAIPVGPPEMVEFLRSEADEVICLREEENFWAVGQFYIDFEAVSDDEVLRTLNQYKAPVAADPSRRAEVVRDGVRLVAVLATPSGTGPFPVVIFVHGLGSGKDSPRNTTIAAHLVDAGMATLLFDLSGHGESSTDHVGGMGAYVADLEAIFAWTGQQPEVRPDLVGIAGSSLGATIAVAALIEGRTAPAAMVLRAPPLEPADFGRINVPSLVLVGSNDPLFRDTETGVRGHPSLTLAVVNGAGHLFEEPGTLEQALDLTVGWFKDRLLRTPQPSTARGA